MEGDSATMFPSRNPKYFTKGETYYLTQEDKKLHEILKAIDDSLDKTKYEKIKDIHENKMEEVD